MKCRAGKATDAEHETVLNAARALRADGPGGGARGAGEVQATVERVRANAEAQPRETPDRTASEWCCLPL